MIGALHASGHHRRRPSPGEVPGPSRDEQRAASHEAVAGLFAPEQDHLRLPVQEVTDAFLAHSRSPMPTDRLVDLFLHGALKREPVA